MRIRLVLQLVQHRQKKQIASGKFDRFADFFEKYKALQILRPPPFPGPYIQSRRVTVPSKSIFVFGFKPMFRFLL